MTPDPWDDLDIPAFLRLTAEERLAGWAAHDAKRGAIAAPAPEPFIKQLAPETEQMLALQAEEKRIRARNRIAKMLDKKVDRTGKRWNPQTCKWE